MQQTPDQTAGPVKNKSHMNKRPPRLIAAGVDEQTPHMHAEQRPHEGEVAEWGEYQIAEGKFIDPLELPESVKRPGFAYRWVAKSVWGSQHAQITRNYTIAKKAGWREVPGDRADGYIVSLNGETQAVIENGGLILMERPMFIEKESRKANARAANDQLQTKFDEIRGMSPDNVRDKVVKLRVDGRPDMVQSDNSGVPD